MSARRSVAVGSPSLASAVAGGAFDVRARAVPLSDIEQTWTATTGSTDRIVVVP